MEIVRKAKQAERTGEATTPAEQERSNRQASPTTKTTLTTKAPPTFTPLTVSEVLAEINRWWSGAGKNAELYRRGEFSEEKAIEYVTCAILQRRGESFEVWKHHAPAVRKALSLCIHELPPEACKVCNGHVRRLIEEGSTA